MSVSWQITGIRQDTWANAHRIPVEETKSEIERGYYIHPELFDQLEEKYRVGPPFRPDEADERKATTAEEAGTRCRRRR
jgi:hypothetical protein